MPKKLHLHLLNWYDVQQRVLPWRARPGEKPNPYYVLLSEFMLQQTTVATVMDYFHRFIHKWPTISDFAKADQEEILHAWQGLGYYARARNLHKCIREIYLEHAGNIPSSLPELLNLPGVGPYTASAIAAIAYDKPTLPMDGNIIRVFSRLLNLQTPLPNLKKEIESHLIDYIPKSRSGDFAQALMDLGATVCRPSTMVNCLQCPLTSICKSYEQNPSLLPFQEEKPQRPDKFGYVFWITTEDGGVLVEKRPPKGLLGGLMGFPTTEWMPHYPQKPEFLSIFLEEASHEVTHVFTHFRLKLKVLKGSIKSLPMDKSYIAVNPENFKDYAFPTLMKKVMKSL